MSSGDGAVAGSRPASRVLRAPGLAGRRAAYFGAVGATTLLGTAMMLDIVGAAGLTALEVGILILFVPTFAWIALSFWNAVIGFTLGVLGRDPLSLERTLGRARSRAPIVTRTALVMPAHNEEPGRLMEGLSAMIGSLEATGQAGHFDVHLLSDTTDAGIAAAEEAAWQALRASVPRPGRLHYRRRPSNVGRKAGNIADFCERWGERYDFMVVLDADSVMSGDTLVELVLTMQANPLVGLLQTVPVPVRQSSLFGRFVQFAGALYSPMLASGQAFWQADSANYWGHNAIVRVRPFVEHARLPTLPGRPPLGGPILSHDFVEAALLRRAGWRVFLLASLDGSHEEVPANLLDFAKRDRRWAQGSLQHLRLLGEPGLHPLSRVHFVLGAMGYVASVLWLLLLLASTAYVLVPGLSATPLLGETEVRGLAGPLSGTGALVPLLALTAVVLFLPKALGVILALARRRPAFGGALPLVASAVLEGVFSILIAPLMMMYHTAFVLGILAGRDVQWGAQARTGRDIPWREAAARTGTVTAVGAAWAGLTLAESPPFFLWLAPIFIGLVLAAPLVRSTSRARWGQALRSRGILLVPSEARPLPELELEGAAVAESRRGGGQARGWTENMATGSMHEVERGLFDLRRGRPLCVLPSSPQAGGAVLCAPVEGLDASSLSALKRLGSGPIRLVVTPQRARTIGLSIAATGLESPGFSLGLNGETAADVYRLSGAVGSFDAARLDPRPATESEAAALALVRVGRLLPAVVCAPADPERVPELCAQLESGALLKVGAADVRQLTESHGGGVVVTHVSEAPVPLEEAEHAHFMLFREANGLLEHVAILIGERERWPDPVPVRLHSACLTGDLFGSLRCDCGEQLRGSLRSFAESGGGILLYLHQEGRGIGLANKLRAYSLQQSGLDTVDADRVLGFGADERRYDAAVGMLRHLGVERVRILTNNPEKVRALEEGGIRVMHREPLHGTLNRHNLPYVRAKVQRAGHWLGDMLRGAVPEV